MQQIVQYMALFACVLAVCLVIILSPLIWSSAAPETYLKGNYTGVGTGLNDGHNPPQEHSRPMCADSTFFRAEYEDEIRSCAWVAHRPVERCNVEGTDNHGNLVPAKEACFMACDTGNCRRRLK